MHRAVEDNGVLAACRELGIGFVPYSPINRGFHGGGAYKRILALQRKRQPPRSSAFPTRRNPRKSAHSRNTQRIRKAARPDLRASRPCVAHVKVAEHSPHSRDNKAFASRRKFALRRRQTFRIRNCRIGGFNFKNRNCRGALQRRTAAEGGIVKQAAAIFALALAAVSPASGKPPIILSDQGSFAVGGTALSDRKGRKFHGDHAYVFYQIPENARKYPLVFAHGVGQFSKTWETTPDGRASKTYFCGRGFRCISQTSRGAETPEEARRPPPCRTSYSYYSAVRVQRRTARYGKVAARAKNMFERRRGNRIVPTIRTKL